MEKEGFKQLVKQRKISGRKYFLISALICDYIVLAALLVHHNATAGTLFQQIHTLNYVFCHDNGSFQKNDFVCTNKCCCLQAVNINKTILRNIIIAKVLEK